MWDSMADQVSFPGLHNDPLFPSWVEHSQLMRNKGPDARSDDDEILPVFLDPCFNYNARILGPGSNCKPSE